MPKPGKPQPDRVIENRKAYFTYAIGETLECGIVLHGFEVKSVREGKVSLAEGYVSVEGTPPAMYLHNVNIAEYGPAAGRGAKTSPTRLRKLLANKREITKMGRAVEAKGTTLVPLKIYFKNGYAKLLVGVGIGRKSHDKREAIKERETKREITRAMSKRVG